MFVLQTWRVGYVRNLAYFVAKDTISQGVIITVQKPKLKLHLTPFFLGFYLFLQVEAPLHVEVVKLRHYLCTGWGKLCTL